MLHSHAGSGGNVISSNNESIGHTLGVTAAVAVSCAVLVSIAVGYLRPLQAAHNDFEKHQHILQAAGLIDAMSATTPAETAELYAQLERRLVDLSSGAWVTGSADTYEFTQAAVDPQRSVALPATQDPVNLGRQALVMPVYISNKEGLGRRVVLPVYGKGMWSEIHAFLALDGDLSTIAALVIHSHGETPGIGDRIEDEEWLRKWRGKSATRTSNDGPLRLAAAASAKTSIHSIDAITGATVTTQSLVGIINFWLGDAGYRKLIDRLRQDALDKGQ